jgi:crotonobetainyl-CoA:carnitine CoA-transferase CaiB-like acyl-CoA transferase
VPSRAPRPLDGIRVVTFGQYVAGSLVTALLGEHGAEVVHIDPPGGPRLPRLAAALHGTPSQRRVLDLNDFGGRREAASLIEGADVVVENFRPGALSRFGLGPEVTASTPGLVFCSLPGFAADDERAGTAAWEGVVMAAGGAYSTEIPTALIPDDAELAGPAVFSPLPLASVFAALHASIAIVAALLARERDGLGQLIEISLADALADAVGVRATSYERQAPRNTDFGHGLFRCADGQYVNLVLVQHRHLEWCSAAIAPQLQADGLLDLERIRNDPQAGNAIRQILVERFATATAAHWEAIGHRAGLAIGRVRLASEWVAQAGRRLDVVADAVALESAPAQTRRSLPAAANRAAPALSGLRVLDMTRVIAGPTAGRVLAQYGAEVLAIDTDPADRASAVDEPVWHEFLNRGKRGAIVDLREEAGRTTFRTLLDDTDIVVQNSSAHSLARHGVDPPTLLTMAPWLTVVSLSAFDATGPWADLRGYAETVNSVTGISARAIVGHVRSGTLPTVDRPRWTFTDTAAGLLGALGAVLGLTQRLRHGHGSIARVCLTGAAMLTQLPHLVEAGSDTAQPEVDVPARGWSAWHQIYECLDGPVFLAVGVSARRAVADALGSPATALATTLARMRVADVVRAVTAAGGGASPIATLTELCDEHGVFQRRGLLLEDTTERHGRLRMIGPVVRLQRTPLLAGAIPAQFGSDAPAFGLRTPGSSTPRAGRTPGTRARA